VIRKHTAISHACAQKSASEKCMGRSQRGAECEVHQIERLLEQSGLSAFSAALHTHDDVLMHM
jgi:hypothetical protein